MRVLGLVPRGGSPRLHSNQQEYMKYSVFVLNSGRHPERKFTRNELYLLENYGEPHRETISGQDSLTEHSTNIRVSLFQPRISDMMRNGF